MAAHLIADYKILMDEVGKYITNPQDVSIIEKAYHYANEKHEGQFRKSGEPYVIHVIQVAFILSTMRVGPRTIAAGLLHDIIEDCDVTKEQFIQDFDEEIYQLVESVTKVGNLSFSDEKEYQAVNHRKIFIAMARDIRVILIKLVDRLHNMRTLEFMKQESQKRIAAETLGVYAPIAHRLGISEIKNELEDLSFYYLEREKYYDVAKMLEVRKSERNRFVNEMIDDISVMLDELNLPHRIFGRSKHIYSIYKKMNQKNKRFDEILDLNAIRIITKTDLQCYEILGYVHQKYRPIPGRLKDYIAVPKMNMYQSLHTTVVGNDGHIFEVQIRTETMDAIAEQGVAAHWMYKEGRKYNPKKEQEEIETKLSWFKDLSEMKDDSDVDAKLFMDSMQKDFFDANVYVMSPKGRIIDLPNGSTPIDFAYRIHTEVGHSTVGAIVNNILVPINTILKTGDVVNLKTSKNSNGPSEDWLKFVKTNQAKNKIRGFLQKKDLESKAPIIEKGEQMLKDEMIKRKIDEKEYTPKKLEQIYSQFNFNNYNDFMYAIGSKSTSLSAIAEKMNTPNKTIFDSIKLTRLFSKDQNKKKTVSKSGVSVAGVDSMKISLAGCCSPVYGDEIVGFISTGQGVKVHRKDCPNILREYTRLIEVHWDEQTSEAVKFEVSLKIESSDRNYLLTDLVTVVSQCKAGLLSINSSVNDDKITATTQMRVSVNDTEHLRTVIANLKKVDSVTKVERIVN